LDKAGLEAIVTELKTAKENFQQQVKNSGMATMRGNALYLKGTKEPLPTTLAAKIRALLKAKENIEPLILFWSKLMKNPTPSAREELYDFMKHNDIQLTPLGDLVLEKGVHRLETGQLVDVHTKKIDHSLGQYVRMDRKLVNSDRKSTCSAGLICSPTL
jgi:hypothetical protein